jgi:hypothetical protein
VLIAARRIAADPYTAFRTVGGVAIAAFVATAIAIGAAVESDGEEDHGSVLDGGVVAVDARGAPDATLAPLLSGGTVVARAGAGGRMVVRCADLARVSTLTCPLPASFGNDSPPSGVFGPTGFAEPEPGDERLPIHSLYVPTDGSTAAQERVRTAVAAAGASALAWTEPEFSYSTDTNIDGFSSGFQLATAFVLFVAACSLTVSVVAGLLERRRPFALLRASGVRLGELRLIALLETAAPLLLTVLGGMATAFVVMFLSLPRAEWALPGPGFFAGAAASVVVTLAVCLVTWPLVDATTRHDNVRYE